MSRRNSGYFVSHPVCHKPPRGVDSVGKAWYYTAPLLKDSYEDKTNATNIFVF